MVADVPAAFAEFRGQPVPDDDAAEVARAVDVPERGDRDAPVFLLLQHSLDIAVEVRRYLVHGKVREPVLVTEIARRLNE
ncbi:MAG TPA: hypothetical protein VGM12_06710 [Trebonia sp.]